ncbi:MAG: aldose 1-epimerase [Acidobacteriota bacterium]
MRRMAWWVAVVIALASSGLAQSTASTAADPETADYRAERTSDQGVPIIRLSDTVHKIELAVIPSVGNTAYEMKINGKNILYFPYTSLDEFQKRPQLSGIPFLAPWANRLDQDAFYANGKKYNFDMELGNVRGDVPLHGLLTGTPYWEVTSVIADKSSARYTARLQFWKHPELMAQWPFAHEYEMTYRLQNGELQVTLTVINLSTEAMPVVIGFHPYYQIPGVPRDQWVGHIPARRHVTADSRLIPTGEYTAMELAKEFPLQGRTLDDGFTDLERDADGRAHFYIKSGNMKVETSFGPKYPVAVVWEPNSQGQPQPFICFEPMSGVTSATNLSQAGKYPGLQTVAPGARWTESFWVKGTGF